MLGELMTVPTDTLVDLLFAFLDRETVISSTDAAIIEQIQHELQRRGNGQDWGFRTVN